MTEKEQAQNALKNLNKFLKENTPSTASLFEELFERQQNELSDDELEEAVKNGFDDLIQRWREEHKTFVENQLMSAFKGAMEVGAATVKQQDSIVFNVNELYIKRQLDCLTKHVLNQLNDEAERTVKVIMQKCQEEHLTPKQTARMIHLTMGLYPRQAIALWNYIKKYYPEYLSSNEPVSAIKKKSPKKSPIDDVLDELKIWDYKLQLFLKRLEMLGEYGLNIAYQLGLHEFYRIYLRLGWVDGYEKIWTTADDEKVCVKCEALSGKAFVFDEKFFDGEYLIGLTPPMHVNCRCTLIYRELHLADGFEKLDFEELSDYVGKLGNLAVRKWYVHHDKGIHDKVDDSLSIFEQALQAFNLRNQYRTQARDLMGDQFMGREYLDWKYPNREWESTIQDKMQRKNMTKDEAIEDIYNTSTKSNKKVNSKYRLE